MALTLAADEEDGRCSAGFAALLDAIVEALEDQRRDGLLRPDELQRMTIPTFARSEKDFRAPFAPKGRFEGLMVEQLEIFNAEDRFWARFQADHDAEAFGAQWAAFAQSRCSHAGGRTRRRDPRPAGPAVRRAAAERDRPAPVKRARADADPAGVGGAGQARGGAVMRVSAQQRSG